MRVLFIGGTGNISTSVSRLAVANGIELVLLNRGRRECAIAGAEQLCVDIDDVAAVTEALGDRTFDAVVNWIAFVPEHIERDIKLFAGRTKQYVFISSASAYEKPPRNAVITESTPLKNPYWEYSRNKIACEERLMQAYRETDFPVTLCSPKFDVRYRVTHRDWWLGLCDLARSVTCWAPHHRPWRRDEPVDGDARGGFREGFRAAPRTPLQYRSELPHHDG